MVRLNLAELAIRGVASGILHFKSSSHVVITYLLSCPAFAGRVFASAVDLGVILGGFAIGAAIVAVRRRATTRRMRALLWF
jgi:hypothetical protein